MGNRKTYASLDAALIGEGIPEANWDTVKAIATAVGATSYTAGSRRGFRAVRPNGPDLRIESGHTIGFVSEAEARAAAPEHEVWPNNSSRSRWGISHFVNAHRDGGDAHRRGVPTEVCAECLMEMTPGGTCDCP